MTFPVVTENSLQLESVVQDTFIDDQLNRAAAALRAASWPWPTHRPTDA